MRFCILIDSREVDVPTLGRRFLRRQTKSDYFFRAQGKFKFDAISKVISVFKAKNLRDEFMKLISFCNT